MYNFGRGGESDVRFLSKRGGEGWGVGRSISLQKESRGEGSRTFDFSGRGGELDVRFLSEKGRRGGEGGLEECLARLRAAPLRSCWLFPKTELSASFQHVLI